MRKCVGGLRQVRSTKKDMGDEEVENQRERERKRERKREREKNGGARMEMYRYRRVTRGGATGKGR